MKQPNITIELYSGGDKVQSWQLYIDNPAAFARHETRHEKKDFVCMPHGDNQRYTFYDSGSQRSVSIPAANTVIWWED